MKLAAALLLTLTAFGQDLSEIRGTVTEFGSATPIAIAGAEVILYECLTVDNLYTRVPVTTVLSNSQGAFSIKPDHPGQYFIEARKPTYMRAEELDAMGPIPGVHMSETRLTITREGRPINLRFILLRPGGVTGRLIDEDDQPIPNFMLIATAKTVLQPLNSEAVTDQDGVFTFPMLVPLSRVIRVGPDSGTPLQIIQEFTRDDIAKVEQDFETTYWPGGVTDPAVALPLNIIPGAVVNLGAIRVRKVPYYRAHLTYSGECPESGQWNVSVVNAPGFMTVPCAKELLIGKLLPGEHILGVSVGRAASPDWSVLQFNIDRENVEVPLAFAPSVDIPGRFLREDGSSLPDLKNVLVALRSVIDSKNTTGVFPIGAQGNFTISGVAWQRNQVVMVSNPNFAIKEFRYNNQPVPDGIIAPVPGALLEIVIDDQPASLSGTAPAQSLVYLAKWPFAAALERPYTFTTRADASGKFQISLLAAGEYRAVAVASDLDVPTLGRLLSTAPRITIERGAQQTIQLR